MKVLFSTDLPVSSVLCVNLWQLTVQPWAAGEAMLGVAVLTPYQQAEGVAEAMGQQDGGGDAHGASPSQRWAAGAMTLCWLVLVLVPWRGVHAQSNSAVLPCPGKPACIMLAVDGTGSEPPIFRAAITNTSINEILLAGPRYVLKPTYWTVYSQQQPYRLTRNLTIQGLQVCCVLLAVTEHDEQQQSQWLLSVRAMMGTSISAVRPVVQQLAEQCQHSEASACCSFTSY